MQAILDNTSWLDDNADKNAKKFALLSLSPFPHLRPPVI